MKKLLVILLVCLGLSIALPALAADWTLTLNYTLGDAGVGGDFLSAPPNNQELNGLGPGGTKDSSNLNGFALVLEYPMDPWGGGLLYSTGKLDDLVGGRDDFYLADLWVGRRIAESDPFQLDLALSYVNMRNGDYVIHGPLVDLIGRADLGSGFSMEGGFGFSLGGTTVHATSTGEDLTETSLSKIYIKGSYEFTDNWSVGLGCYQYKYTGTTLLGDLDGKATLYTLGVTYRFGTVKPAEKPKEEPKVEEPKKEEPKKEEPKVEEPKKEEPKVEEPKKEEPKEEPKVEEPKKEEPKVEEAKVEEPAKVETPEQKQERVARINEFLHPIFFDFDKYVIRTDQLPFLWQSLKVLKDNPDLYILIAGHADHPGSDDYNKKLSEHRAIRICEWLIANGIDGSRITIVGYGEEYPYMAESNDPSWESDRWVDIVVSENPLAEDAGIRK